MELKDLTGFPMVLTGVDTGSIEDENSVSASTIAFVLDDVIYRAYEDPSNGYRSSMRELTRMPYDTPVANRFPGCVVVGRMKEGNGSEILELVDEVTGKVVLKVGTSNTDDYYPCFVSDFSPDNMAINSTPETIAAAREKMKDASADDYGNWAKF